jgi:hypothetical protein
LRERQRVVVLSQRQTAARGVDDRRRIVQAGANSWLALVCDGVHPTRDDATRSFFPRVAGVAGVSLAAAPCTVAPALHPCQGGASAADSKFCRAARSLLLVLVLVSAFSPRAATPSPPSPSAAPTPAPSTTVSYPAIVGVQQQHIAPSTSSPPLTRHWQCVTAAF